MGNLEKHIRLAKEKLEDALEAREKGRYSVVGDLAIKVVEEAIEAHAAKLGRDLGDHRPRADFLLRYYGPKRHAEFQHLFDLCGDLGYDGKNGENARKAIQLMFGLLAAIEKSLGVEIRGSKKSP